MRTVFAFVLIATLALAGCGDRSRRDAGPAGPLPSPAASEPSASPSPRSSQVVQYDYTDDAGDQLDRPSSDQGFSDRPIDPATGTEPQPYDPSAPIEGDVVTPPGSSN